MNAMTPAATQLRHPDHVINAYCRLVAVTRQSMCEAEDRTRVITRHRHCLWWLMRDLTTLSYARIGAYFGGRDTSTVQVAIEGMADKIASDSDLRRHLMETRALIASMPVDVTQPEDDQAMALARRLLITAAPDAQDVRKLAACMISLAVVIRSPELTNEEARIAATRTLNAGGGALHG
jgi:hypothetical protein